MKLSRLKLLERYIEFFGVVFLSNNEDHKYISDSKSSSHF